MFLDASDKSVGDSMIHVVGIDADWVALKLCGQSIEDRIRTLDPGIRSAVLEASVAVKEFGAKLVKEGLLKFMNAEFLAASAEQNAKFKPPQGLFLLTDLGQAKAFKLRAKKNKDSIVTQKLNDIIEKKDANATSEKT